jgi:hypothetical protein
LPEEGFIDFKMINRWMVGKEIKSLTIIDSDLYLANSFFEKIIEGHIKAIGPNFLTYRNHYQIIGGMVYRGGPSMVYNGSEGATGYVISFNKAFLDNYKFNENFIHTGNDFFLTDAIMGRCMELFKNEFKKVPKTTFGYIECDIIHIWHVRDRLTP